LSSIHTQLAPIVREHGVSAVAAKVGIHREHLSAWVSGRRSMRIEHIEAAAAAVNHEIVVVPKATKKRRTRLPPE
jgi:DNA-binding phage protein